MFVYSENTGPDTPNNPLCRLSVFVFMCVFARYLNRSERQAQTKECLLHKVAAMPSETRRLDAAHQISWKKGPNRSLISLISSLEFDWSFFDDCSTCRPHKTESPLQVRNKSNGLLKQTIQPLLSPLISVRKPSFLSESNQRAPVEITACCNYNSCCFKAAVAVGHRLLFTDMLWLLLGGTFVLHLPKQSYHSHLFHQDCLQSPMLQ